MKLLRAPSRTNYARTLAASAVLLGLLLSACGGGGVTPPASGISGIITSPSGDVAGTIVAACASEACDPETDGSNGVQISSSGSSASYTIPVTSGTFAVVALQDTNGDGQVSIGDYGGAYPEAVTAPASGIDITLAPLSASSNLETFKSTKRFSKP